MENWWMNKCNSTLPSMASSSSQELRNQMEMNPGYISCPPGSQDIRPSMLGRLQDPLFPNLQSSCSHRSEHVNLGNSFLSLLSGSPSLFQNDFQHFSNPKPIGTSGKLLPESNNSILNGTQSAIPLLSSRILPENLSGKVLQSGTGFCPNGSSKVVASSSCASNPILHDMQSSDLTNVVICQMVPGKGKVKRPFSSSGEWHSTVPADMGKAYRANILASQKMTVEANSFTSNQSSGVWHNASHADTGNVCRGTTQTSQKVPEEAQSFISNQASSLWHTANSADNGRACRDNVQNSKKIPMEANSSIPSQASDSVNGCPRVFCSTTSGYLLVSNTGLIGILCSCHTFHMSAYKFCEHSGLYGVNPGETIYMDSGETIAQWCRLYLLKFGIMVPGDKSEWDWPEELSANAGLMKSSVPMLNISNSSSGCSPSSKQYYDGFSSKSQSLFIGAVSNKQQRNTQDTNNIFLKALTGSSQSNLHIVADNLIMEHAMPTSKVVHNRVQDGCQFISAYNGSMQNGTFSITRPSLQGQRVVGKESNFCRIENTKDGAFRDSAISNIELKLGQPYQLAQTSGNPDISTAGPQLRCTDANPMKSLFPQQMVPNTANCREDVVFRQCLHFAADPSNPGEKGDRNQLNRGNNAFIISNATYETRVERNSTNLAQDLLLTNLRSPPKEATRSKANNYMLNDSGHTLRYMLHSEPQPAKYDPANVPQSRSNNESQLDMSQLGLSSSFNRLSGNYESHFPTAHKNSCYSHQLSAVPPGTPDSRKCSNYPEKVISFGNYGQVDHVYHQPLPSSMGSELIFPKQAVSKGTTLCASTSLSDLTPANCREEFTGVRTHFPDDKLQVPSPRQMQEISKKQHVLPSLSKNQGEGRVGCSSYMQHSLGDNSASEVQKLGLTSKHNVSEATCKPHQSGLTCGIGSDEGFASMTGVNCCCHISRYEQGNALNFNENSIVPLSNGHPSPRSGKSVTEPREDEKFCHKVPYGYVNGSSSCAVHRNCLERNHELSVCSSPNAHKEHMGTVNGEASVIYSPQFANNHIVAKDKTIPSDPKSKLSELPKNSADHTSQWRDVPCKVKGLSDVTRVDRLANLFDARRQDREKLGDTCTKCFNGTLKEHEISNISSGCSAPAVSQASCEVNHMNSSTNDAMDNGHASDLVIDEGSGIDKAWSSDDARESEKNTEFVASTGSSQRKVGSPENLNHQSSFSLLNELKLLNSLTWQKGRNQNPGGFPSHEKYKLLQNLETGKRKRGLVLEILNDSSLTSDPSRAPQETSKGNCVSQSPNCPSKCLKIPLPSRQSETHTIGPCVTESKSKPRLHVSAKKLLRKRNMRRRHNVKNREVNSVHQTELNHGTNNCEIVEVSGEKKFKRDCRSNYISQFQIQESSYDDAKKTKHNSTDTLKSTSIQQVINGHRNARPIVCGKYGELADESSTGEMSKPAKVVPLSRVLKSARKCTVPTICKPKSTSFRQLKRRSIGGNISCNTFPDLKTEKKFDSNLFLLEKQGDDRTEKDHCKQDSHTQLQLKPKEIRKRSIYELTGKGEDPSFENSSVSKISNCLPAMQDGKLVNTGEDSGLCKHIAKKCHCLIDSDASCCVCGNSNQDEINKLLECSQCSIKVHQACYGVSRVPKGRWCCRPCRTSSKDTVCVLCGYGGGAMTQALGSRTIVKSILRAWNTETDVSEISSFVSKIKEHNSITVGLLDLKTKQWIHMVCGLWTPETRCPNVDTMSAFDVSGVPLPGPDVVCCLCKRAGGSCIQCRVVNCYVRFHPWCAHQKGLLQTEIEGVDNESVGFYGRCAAHATQPMCEADNDPVDTDTTCLEKGKLTCARSEGYKGRIRDGFRHNYCGRAKGNSGCLVHQEQLNAWEYINGQKLCTKELSQLAISDVEHDCRKEYARYRQAKSWKHLVVYKSGIHALGLYTSRFISRDEMVVEYVGEIVGQRVADKREIEYQSGKKLQYKSACYFFRIDKEHIIDATSKGGIARFVNHSCSPNCIAKVISVRNEKKVVFLAERDIFPGEEITYDYHFNHEDEGKKIPCFCNSKNCRRYLN